MAKRYVTVRVVGKDARPKRGCRVGIGGMGFLDGVTPAGYTNSEGQVEAGIEYSGCIDIYVDGWVAAKGVPIQSNITVTV